MARYFIHAYLLHQLRVGLVIFLVVCFARVYATASVTTSFDQVIADIYEQMVEIQEVDYDELQSTLYELAEHPIDLNHTTERELSQLPFLTSLQIDNILLYIHDHPMESTSELLLVKGFKEYEVYNLLPFVTIHSVADTPSKLYAKEIFTNAHHEVLTRIDARKVENFTGDPAYIEGKYKFNYANRVQFGATLRRPAGGKAKDLLYGGYIQLNDISIFRTIVAGSYQAHFGQGLVFSGPFHLGKRNYVLQVGQTQEGLKKYTSPNGEGLQGLGTTMVFGDPHRIEISTSVLYSIQRYNDSTLQHTIGANITFTHNCLKVGITASEKIYSDSIDYYHNPKYTHRYFHGNRQAVIGLNARYHWQWIDLFGEVAAAQNTQWGIGTEIGIRMYPLPTMGIVALYRYYSPTFDNIQGYAFSETSRVHDEHGGYLGIELNMLKAWQFSVYGDVFYFSGIKYGIPYSPSWGYDTYAEARFMPKKKFDMLWQVRLREKAKKSTYSLRYQFNWSFGGWRLRSQADANIVKTNGSALTWGASVFQDVQYTFTIPLSLTLRMQAFDARVWDNRIYTFENDVLYGFSIPAMYGQGLRAYLNVRYKPLDILTFYLRVSESWYYYRASSSDPTQTDIHLLLRLCI